MDRKKILIIENSVHITGALNSVLRSCAALQNKYDFIFIFPRKSKASRIAIEKNFQVFEIPMQELSKRWQSILFYIPSLIRSTYLVRRIAKDQGISIVHVNDFYNLIMPMWRLCGGSIKYLCYVNFVPDRFPFVLRKLWIGSHMIFSSKMITVSRHVLKQLPTSDKIGCIPCPLPVEPNFDAHLEKRKVLLFMGNFMEGKGQDMAIRAFAGIAKDYPDWKIRFVGGDMDMEKNRIYRTELLKLSEELSVEKQIEWSGFSDDVANEYYHSSIALNFSKSESFSLTVQEAMFYGCPVIATRSGGPDELVDDKNSGLLVTIDDIEAMSEAMKYLIENPDERSRITVNAARSIREKCGKANTVDRLDLVYRTIFNH